MTPRVVINYIHGGFVDDKYHSKRQKRRLVRATSVREKIHIVQCTFIGESVRPINGPISFHLINSNRVILPHKDALVLTLGVDGFDVRTLLIDPGSPVNLLQNVDL